jgi:hypothetical protein
MANKTASIWKYVNTANGWRHCKLVMKANHKIDLQRVFLPGTFFTCCHCHWLLQTSIGDGNHGWGDAFSCHPLCPIAAAVPLRCKPE